MLMLHRNAIFVSVTKTMIWTILGFSVGIVAFFCVAVAETLVGKPVFEENRMYIAAVFTAAGVVAWFLGRYFGARKREAQKENEEDDEITVTAQFVLFDLRYWGPMLMTLGVIALFIRPLRQEKIEVATPVRPPVKQAVVVVAAPLPEPVKPKAPVVFPVLKMQGVIFRETEPYAIINGQSYAVGDRLGEVTVKSIDRTGVVLELSGELKMLTLK